MRPIRSLQLKLSLGLAAGVTVIWLAAALAGTFVVRHELDEAFDSALQETAQRLLVLVSGELLRYDGPETLAEAEVDPHEEYLTYLVRDSAGRVLLESHAALRDAFPDGPAEGFRTTATHRVYGEANRERGIVIEVAEPLEHREEAAREAALSLTLPLLALIPLSLLGVWWLVRRGMRPINALRERIETRGAEDLSSVAVTLGPLPDELRPIAESVDLLLERLRRVLAAERSFTENSAHELRTPIAAALAQTQRLIAETPEGPLRERAGRIEDTLHRLARMAEKLMQLARAEGGALTAEAKQDLIPVLRLVVEELEHSSEGRGRLRLELPEPASLCAWMDADAFAILLRNLIENALKHGDPDAPVTVRLARDGALHVVNAGPPVPPETLAGLTERFERGAGAGEGAGLGLAIAEAIAQRGGASLELRSPASGRDDGFEAVVRMARG